QGFGCVLMLSRPRKWWGLVLAGLGGGALAALAYLSLNFLMSGRLPDEDLTSPFASGLVASFGCGVLAGFLATIAAPLSERALDPDVSADAIFAHCTEGVRLGRGAGIPEPILDFMHMHHGNGLLEYFWHKNQEQGNPKRLSEKHFRYPGLPPQTKETGILAICDAVEAASRTLKSPSERDLTSLVQRIVFGKLRLGQLDQSGLTSSDLKALCNSLVDTLKSAFHVRIEYPWQKEEGAAKAAEA